jgi:hypothetical protein
LQESLLAWSEFGWLEERNHAFVRVPGARIHNCAMLDQF